VGDIRGKFSYLKHLSGTMEKFMGLEESIKDSEYMYQFVQGEALMQVYLAS